MPWTRTKSFDTFGPIGPFVVPTELISNPHQLDIAVKVNEEIRQHGNTAKMIFKIPELIHYISRYMTLSPGDIIATGTPAGVSEIHDGDVVSVEIDKIGVLQNRVVAE
jgi:2-keto-4-pentenoate hydratase/2-oxohepta-3-ene-1,7-dioic acid hydratase in catechol pathway